MTFDKILESFHQSIRQSIITKECDALIADKKFKRKGAWSLSCNHPENNYIYFKCTAQDKTYKIQTEFEVAIPKILIPQSALARILIVAANSSIFYWLNCLALILQMLTQFFPQFVPIPVLIGSISFWISLIFVTIFLTGHLVSIQR